MDMVNLLRVGFNLTAAFITLLLTRTLFSYSNLIFLDFYYSHRFTNTFENIGGVVSTGIVFRHCRIYGKIDSVQTLWAP